MCLTVVTKRTPRQRAVKVAYKIVRIRSPKRVSGGHLGCRIRLSRWQKATMPKAGISYGSGRYDAGFHVFARRQDAETNNHEYGVVLPVKVRGIHTVGRQWNSEVWVAQELFVSAVDVRKALAAGR